MQTHILKLLKMVTLTRFITIQLGKYLKHALPDVHSFEGDEFMMLFAIKPNRN